LRRAVASLFPRLRGLEGDAVGSRRIHCLEKDCGFRGFPDFNFNRIVKERFARRRSCFSGATRSRAANRWKRPHS